jgi:peptidoglycan/LPS O-acetylase OafA/YrhL
MSDDSRTLTFRPHLDGLRAVAVVMVFVFHAAPAALPGGFIGVDVFFVLSGYLITRILLLQVDTGQPRLLRSFYVRRVKRLLPASLVLLTAVLLREMVWGAALELQPRLREIRATVLYVANWNLIAQSDDYFAEGLAASPLRHMWSLAVEEQFYFVWPVALVVLAAVFRRRRLPILAFVTAAVVASAAAMVVIYSPDQVSRVYYGTDTRVFQPLAGAALAVAMHHRVIDLRRSTSRVVGSAGLVFLGALLAGGWLLDGTSPGYFRWGAIAVAVAALLLIASTEVTARSAVARVLGARPLVLLGAVSYGFYLWHWPIIVWVQAPAGASFAERRAINLIQFLLSLAAATASYVLVERPVRQWRARATWPTYAMSAVAMAAVLVAASFALRIPGDSVAAAATKDRSYEPCPDNPRPCVKVEGAGPSAPTVVLVGDSTSQAYDPALKALAAKYGFRYVQAAVGGCPIGHRFLATGEDGELHKSSNYLCFDEMPGIYAEVLERWDPALVLATSWNETNRHVTDGTVVESGTPRHLEETRAALEEAVATLTSQGAAMVFIDILPPGPSVACLEKSPPDQGSCVRPVRHPTREDPYNDLFASLADQFAAVLGSVDLEDVVCPDDACPLMIDGTVVRYDGGHFTGTQSEALAPVIDERLRAIGVDLGAL